jgi:hypothetical protein
MMRPDLTERGYAVVCDDSMAPFASAQAPTDWGDRRQ